MLSVLVLLGVLATSHAQSEVCCAPNVWEGELHGATGYVTNEGQPKSVDSRDGILFDYDTKAEMYYHSSHYTDGTSRSFKILSHYATKKQYFIEAESCHVSDLTTEMQRYCVHDTSEFVGELYYGAGEHTMTVNRYRHRETNPEGQDIGATYLTVTKDGCIPVEALTYMTGREPGPAGATDAITASVYLNIRPQITDPEELVPPATCEQKAFPSYIEDLPGYQYYMSRYRK